MKKVYLDCDGVILDTINTSYQMIKKMSLTTEDEIRGFYRSISWEQLIFESGEIDNAISKIKELSSYFDISILTHVNSENEERVKLKYFGDKLPGINVIPVPRVIEKADFIEPNGAILVDDFLPNLEYWEKKGGIPVKFSNSDKECPYVKITDLLQLKEINFRSKGRIK